MSGTMRLVCLGLLAAGLLGGCASSADLKKVDERAAKLETDLGAMQDSLKGMSAMLKKMEGTLATFQKTVNAGLQAAAKKADAKLAAQDADVKAALANVKKMETSLAALAKTVDTRLQAVGKRFEKIEADVAAAGKQLPAVKAEIDKFGARFKQMNSSVAEAQSLIIKNLENARDIYKTQFLALEEVLQNLKKPKSRKLAPAPAPAPKP